MCSYLLAYGCDAFRKLDISLKILRIKKLMNVFLLLGKYE